MDLILSIFLKIWFYINPLNSLESFLKKYNKTLRHKSSLLNIFSKDIAEFIIKNNGKILKAFGVQGRNQIKDKFSWDTITNQIFNVYKADFYRDLVSIASESFFGQISM